MFVQCGKPVKGPYKVSSYVYLMALLFQMPGFALYNHFSHSFALDTSLYRVVGQVLTDIRIPFITIAYFMFLWTCIRLIYCGHLLLL